MPPVSTLGTRHADPEEYRVWVTGLRTGDRVQLYDSSYGPVGAADGEPVRVTPTGRVYVGGYRGVDWSRRTVHTIPGAGTRWIGPVVGKTETS